jgi:hypothetical protein
MIYQLNMMVKPRELWEFWVVNKYNTYPALLLVVLKVDLVVNHKMALDHYRVKKQVNLLRQRTG